MLAAPFFSANPASTMSSSPSKPAIYKVIFVNQGQVFEIYAKQIFQSDLWGFLEIEELVFGERTQVVVDPSEEKLKAQFEGVVRSFVPCTRSSASTRWSAWASPRSAKPRAAPMSCRFPCQCPTSPDRARGQFCGDWKGLRLPAVCMSCR